MARVRSIPSTELPADLADIYERFAAGYGPFRNQVAVFAHVPAALRHLMSMLMELRAAATLPKRYLELAIVAVSQAERVRLLRRAPQAVPGGRGHLGRGRGPRAGVRRSSGVRRGRPAGGGIRDRRLERSAPAARSVCSSGCAQHFSEAQIVELTLRITLCGFFNRFNDALRIEEESEATARLAAIA